ncbi:MAG: zinc ribbon domain-containing protein [Clostridiales bacterium]|nr:zinc ribbon domain-containing protein [Clostridiales bacterium]
MALVKCPECGKLNVSDTAESCPECGYAIKEHFQRVEKQKILDAKTEAEAKRLEAELNGKLAEIDRLTPCSEPQKPSKLKHIFFYNGNLSLFSWALIVLAVLFLLMTVTDGFMLWIVLFSLMLVIGVPFSLIITGADWSIMNDSYKREYDDWKKQTEDWEGYKREKKEAVRKEYARIASDMAYYGTRTTPIATPVTQSNKLKCPVCGSTDIARISTLNRTVSVVTGGLASSKIGKQYECKKCKHKW